MRIVYAGTPEFALRSLKALHDAGHEIAAVMTQPDRPAGRGMKLQASPVKVWALEHGIEVLQPLSLKLDGRAPQEASQAQDRLLALAPDLMVVAAYGLLLPQWTLSLPRWGCVNIHASLLPRWRGAAPIHRAIEAGDDETGVCLMQMDEGLDTGDVLMRSSLQISPEETTGSLHERLADLGASMVVDLLKSPGPWPAERQEEHGLSYARKIDKAEAILDWRGSAEQLERQVRAFQPTPGACFFVGEDRVKVWAAAALGDALDEEPGSDGASGPSLAGEPGQVLQVSRSGVDVACGQGVLRLRELQKAGGRRQSAADWALQVPGLTSLAREPR